MKVKLIKEGFNKIVGKYYKKKFYEYGMYSRDELKKRSMEHDLEVKKVLLIRAEAVKTENKKNQFYSFPKFTVPQIPQKDVNDIMEIHFKEKILGTVQKHNGNIQVYVDVDMPDEAVVDTEKIIEKPESEVSIVAEPKKAGRPKKNE